ncbi:MAG: AsmA-like C-terminal region-containing protein [Methyloligellaceae bacterium]
MACALAVVSIGLFSLVPALHDEKLIRDRLTARLAGWTGGSVEVSGATHLSYFPVIALHANAVRITATNQIPGVRELRTKVMRAEVGLWSLLFDAEPTIQHLTLSEPLIELDASPPARGQTASANLEPALVSALRSAPTSRITIANGVLNVSGTGSAEKITELSADLTIDGSGAASGEGTFEWRGQQVSVSLKSDSPTVLASTAKSPVRVDLNSELVTARIEGEAAIADGLQVHGDLELSIADLRRFTKWMGLLVPDGPGLGAFKASGTFNWLGKRIAFDDGTFALDGNKALGAMALKFEGPRPAIEGTLALDTLDLAPYLTGPKSGKQRVAKDKEAPVRLDFPILHHLDVDLRVSTTQIRAAALSFAQSAFSVSLKAGKLSGDFAVFDLCGGKGDGRLELNAALPLPRFNVSTTMTGASVQVCIKSFAKESPVEGKVDLTMSLTSEGRSSRELLERLGGELTFSMASGQANVDLTKVLAMARKRELRGWAAVTGTPTRFDSLAARFELEKGNARSDSFKVQTGKTTITGEGTIDLASRRLNWRLSLARRAAGPLPEIRALVARLADALVISGPLSDPIIRLEKKRAGSEGPSAIRAAQQ